MVNLWIFTFLPGVYLSFLGLFQGFDQIFQLLVSHLRGSPSRHWRWCWRASSFLCLPSRAHTDQETCLNVFVCLSAVQTFCFKNLCCRFAVKCEVWRTELLPPAVSLYFSLKLLRVHTADRKEQLWPLVAKSLTCITESLHCVMKRSDPTNTTESPAFWELTAEKPPRLLDFRSRHVFNLHIICTHKLSSCAAGPLLLYVCLFVFWAGPSGAILWGL